MTTPCECLAAGYCPRHNMNKAGRLFELCQTDNRYFTRWEQQKLGYKHRVVPIPYNHWAPLHYYPIKHWYDWDITVAKKWFTKWQSNIPGGSCPCRDNWSQEVKSIPPQFETPRLFFEWAWHIHDTINIRLEKTYRPTLPETYIIWASDKSLWTPDISLTPQEPTNVSMQ